jgi:polyferredoxin
MEHEGMAMSQDMMDMMAGMPEWLVWGELLAFILVSLLLVIGLNRRPLRAASHRHATLNLLRLPLLEHLIRSRGFPFFLQLPMVLLFLLIIGAGLFGTQLVGQNITPLLTWTVWWAGLILLILFLGKFWCVVCPWDAIAEWIERLSFWRRRSSTLSLGLKWPVRWRNIYIATGLFIALTWLELGYGITFSPRATAYLGILMIVLAVVSALVFDRKAFCRYACFVGRVSGMYALFSPLELRSRDRAVCRSCRTHDCYRGNDRGYPCPTYQYLGTMETNTYCILCMECVKTCPHDNVAVNVRPFGSDLAGHTRGQADEAYLVIVMLCLTVFHGLTMTPAWSTLLDGMKQGAGIGELSAFSAGMGGILIVPALLYTGTVWGVARLEGGGSRSVKQAFITYAYPFLPIALFYHIAHNSEHFFMEGPKIVALASDPFGWGWNLFGTAGGSPGPWLALSTIWWIQGGLLLVGQGAGVAILVSIARRNTADRKRAWGVQLPLLVLMTVFSLFNLWLSSQPMTMRSGM